MTPLFIPTNKPLIIPGRSRRAIRMPDLREIFTPGPSGMPLQSNEVDYDDLVVHRNFRSFSPEKPSEVKYFMYELSQKDPGADGYDYFWKAVRFVRLTRVPRYLRQGNAAGPNLVFEQQRDVLAALREQGALFLNLIAKSPSLPLIFAYGVSGIGQTPKEAQEAADKAYAVLTYQLEGTYQQLEYAPLSIEQGELIARYQAEWGELAVARGRPIPTSGTLANSMLDGNRSDVESTNNQLESFIRGMGDKSFMLSLITVPLSPAEITMAWRNVTQKLSEVRSEQDGSRSVTAGVALPLAMGTSQGDGSSNSHSTGNTTGLTTTATEGNSSTYTDGVNNSVSASRAEGLQQSLSQALGQSSTLTDSYSDSTGGSVSNSATYTDGVNSSVSTGQSVGTTQTEGINKGSNVNSSQSITNQTNLGQSWSNSATSGSTASVSQGEGWSAGNTNTNGSNSAISTNTGDSSSGGWNQATGNDAKGGVLGFGGGANSSEGTSGNTSLTNSSGVSAGTSSSSAASSTVNASRTDGFSQSTTLGETFGGTVSTGVAAANSVSSGTSVGTSSSLAVNSTQSATASQGTSQSVAQSVSDTVSRSYSQGQSLAQGVNSTQTAATAVSGTDTASNSSGNSQSLANGKSASSSVASNQAFSDAYMVAMSRQAGSNSSLGVVPNFGVVLTKMTKDEGKRFVGDLLEAQMRRYAEGIKSGAFLYQMYLVCPDRETLAGGSGLLKSAFWGAGSINDPLPQPFHVIDKFDKQEKNRMLAHVQAFTSYRRREPVTELIEPFLYSSYITPSEAATFCHPPTSEALGLLAVHDSMPIMRMPADRTDRDVSIGYVINGEKAKISDWKFGVDINEITHTLITGVTGSGKTTTLMKLLSQLASVQKEVTYTDGYQVIKKQVRPSILCLDWMRNMRNLASVVESDRFQFFSLLKPELGRFTWNPLAIPSAEVGVMEWMNAQSDNFTASFNLGEFGRSLISEFLHDLYSMNRLVDNVLRPEFIGEDGVVRPAIILPAIDKDSIPDNGKQISVEGVQIANVFTCPDLSRCVSMEHLSVLVITKIQKMSQPEEARIHGTAIRDRLQSLWRRMQYYAPGNQFTGIITCDNDLTNRSTLSITDLVNPDTGVVTVIETDGLDYANRRLILGSIMLSLYRLGLAKGEGFFDHNGKGPGTFVILEEAHEIFGEQGPDEDSYSASTRTALYESMFRRVRALGLRMVAVVQNPASIPAAITANTSTVFVHQTFDDKDRQKIFSMLNWSHQIGQQQREWRYLGEMARGYVIIRLPAINNYLEAAPVHIITEPAVLSQITDRDLVMLLDYKKSNR